ncbi:hypothetical protein FA13DRAFT_716067 [Coprinellus micaceus]|uniref:Secreted protein n=1 Tax=Coprinellus micaceus TaxID=71717 RepID=A0A4Y7TV10_COPMI|nr:hypothetical protein FA13DRAFT_716067 [Coprinellus micaceus]
MSEGLGFVLAYLSTCFFCCNCCGRPETIEEMQLGSEFRGRTKRNPREQEIDDEFMARNYTRDAAGRIHMEPRPSQISQNVKPEGKNESFGAATASAQAQ